MDWFQIQTYLYFSFIIEQENLYTFDHYFGVGQRRADSGETNAAARDFAEDGGFLCPSGRFKIKGVDSQYNITLLLNFLKMPLLSFCSQQYLFYLKKLNTQNQNVEKLQRVYGKISWMLTITLKLWGWKNVCKCFSINLVHV